MPRVVSRIPLLRCTYGLLNRIVMAGDGIVIVASGLLAVPAVTPAQAALLAVIEASLFVTVLRQTGAYRFERYEHVRPGLLHLLPGLLCAWAAGALCIAAFRPDVSTSALMLTWHAPQLAGLVGARLLARAMARAAHRRKLIRRLVVLIGANAAGEAILRQLLDPNTRMQYEVVQIFSDRFDPQPPATMLGLPVAREMNLLAAYAQSHVIDLVIVALPLPRAVKVVEMIEALHWIAADVVVPLDELGLHPSSARVARIAGVPTLQVLNRPLKGSQALLKLAEDYVLGTIALLMISPLLLLVAIAIRLDSKGPVFFLQERTGFTTKSFMIYKFRTMTVDPDDDGSSGTMSRDNPRITRVGRVLRRLSIDELPQLINVLRGDMSIVGPRPYVPNMLVGDTMFRDAVHNCAFRYRLKPGITGLAQANGMRSNALRSMHNAERSVEMDVDYIMNWSIWLDMRIMLRTLVTAMSGPEVF